MEDAISALKGEATSLAFTTRHASEFGVEGVEDMARTAASGREAAMKGEAQRRLVRLLLAPRRAVRIKWLASGRSKKIASGSGAGTVYYGDELKMGKTELRIELLVAGWLLYTAR